MLKCEYTNNESINKKCLDCDKKSKYSCEIYQNKLIEILEQKDISKETIENIKNCFRFEYDWIDLGI